MTRCDICGGEYDALLVFTNKGEAKKNSCLECSAIATVYAMLMENGVMEGILRLGIRDGWFERQGWEVTFKYIGGTDEEEPATIIATQSARTAEMPKTLDVMGKK